MNNSEQFHFAKLKLVVCVACDGSGSLRCGMEQMYVICVNWIIFCLFVHCMKNKRGDSLISAKKYQLINKQMNVQASLIVT